MHTCAGAGSLRPRPTGLDVELEQPVIPTTRRTTRRVALGGCSRPDGRACGVAGARSRSIAAKLRIRRRGREHAATRVACARSRRAWWLPDRGLAGGAEDPWLGPETLSETRDDEGRCGARGVAFSTWDASSHERRSEVQGERGVHPARGVEPTVEESGIVRRRNRRTKLTVRRLVATVRRPAGKPRLASG